MLFTAVLSPAEEGGYIALNPETGATTQGETVDEAISNLKEATSLYLEEFRLKRKRLGLLTSLLLTPFIFAKFIIKQLR